MLEASQAGFIRSIYRSGLHGLGVQSLCVGFMTKSEEGNVSLCLQYSDGYVIRGTVGSGCSFIANLNRCWELILVCRANWADGVCEAREWVADVGI